MCSVNVSASHYHFTERSHFIGLGVTVLMTSVAALEGHRLTGRDEVNFFLNTLDVIQVFN